jgi:N-ethylmaleimide reductase
MRHMFHFVQKECPFIKYGNLPAQCNREHDPHRGRPRQSLMNQTTATKTLAPRQLFTSLKIGPTALKHRIVMAPLTRSRSEEPGDVPGRLMLDYYTQRTSDGGLIITEATNIFTSSRGWYGAPGIYNVAQVAAWRKIVNAIHNKGGFVFNQLWHVGRSSASIATGGVTPVAPSVDPAYWLEAEPSVSTPNGWVKPEPHRALEVAEIKAIIEDYRNAAVRARAAGFDGVELHAGNGYLPAQFLQDGSKKRTDQYGGSIENRCRFTLQIVQALTSVWGDDKVAVRIAPGGVWNRMSDRNPDALYTYLAEQLNRFSLAYLRVIEPRVKGNVVIHEGQGWIATAKLRKFYKGVMNSAGGYEPDTAEALIKSGDSDLVTFGRYFVSNPDLVRRVEKGFPLSPYDRATFYTFDAKGYSDYLPFKE